MLVLMTYFRVHFLVATAALVGCLLGSSSAIARPTASPNWNRDNPVSHAPLHRPRQNKGSSDPVTWNGDSFSVIGENIFLYAAEFHPWRLPVPELWRDPLQKLKAAGINTISIYTHWALVMPSPDPASVSLEAPANRLADFLTIAKEVGVFVILRPGPYINAETTGGGMPGWVQNLDSQLRVNTTKFNDAWKPYVKAVLDAAAPFQVKQGAQPGMLDTASGTLLAVQVENEFQQTPDMEAYFEEIIRFYRANRVTVPTTFNALSGTKDYVNNTLLNIWGQDSYPQNFDCARPSVWAPVQNYTTLSSMRKSNPASIPEFQGGSYDAWGGSGYDSCAALTNASFVRVFEKSILGDGVKFKSNYMGSGGTNWGNLAFGGLVYTSYDYGSGLDERRMKRDKLAEIALIGSFLQSFPAFAIATVQQQSVNMGVSEQSSDVFVSHLKGADDQTSFYTLRHSDSSSSKVTSFRLNVSAEQGPLTIPQSGTMNLVGRDAIIVPANVRLNASRSTLQYSTADVSFLGSIDKRDVVVLHGHAGYKYEFALQLPNDDDGKWNVTTSDSDVQISDGRTDSTVIQWTAANNKAATVQAINTSGVEVLVRLVDIDYAHKLSFVSQAPVASLDGILGRGQRIIVHGAYHIANQTTSGSTVSLVGQLNGTSTLEVIGSLDVKQVTFNGVQPTGATNTTAYGSLIATFAGASEQALTYQPPALTNWKMMDSLPEIDPHYVPDDNWRSANLTSTPNAWFANSTTPNVLFADAYGFHAGGAMLWQARFNITAAQLKDEAPAQLSVKYIGGKYFASSTYLNGNFVGATKVPTDTQSSTGKFNLKQGALIEGENIFTVLMDSTGLEEVGSVKKVDKYSHPLETTKQPRGILAFDLLSSDGKKVSTNIKMNWIVTGNQGGEKVLDKVRGPLNEGGFHAERQGWHLPGFDDSAWILADPTTKAGGLNASGVRFYRTTVQLDVPDGHDIPLSLVYGGDASDPTLTWRSLLFVNGWQFGKRFVQYGPQVNFPIPPGILDPKGNNTVALALWSPDEKGAVIPSLKLEKQATFAGAVAYTINNPTYQQVRKSDDDS